MVEWEWQGKTEILGEQTVPVPLCLSPIWQGLAFDRTRVSAMRGRWLTTWANARPWSSKFISAKFNYSVPTSQKTHYFSITYNNQLMLFKEIIIAYCEKQKETQKPYTPFGRKVNIFNATTGHVSMEVWQPGATWSRWVAVGPTPTGYDACTLAPSVVMPLPVPPHIACSSLMVLRPHPTAGWAKWYSKCCSLRKGASCNAGLQTLGNRVNPE